MCIQTTLSCGRDQVLLVWELEKTQPVKTVTTFEVGTVHYLPVCVCVCVYMYVFVHIHMPMWVRTYMPACVCVCVHECLHACVWVHACMLYGE